MPTHQSPVQVGGNTNTGGMASWFRQGFARANDAVARANAALNRANAFLDAREQGLWSDEGSVPWSGARDGDAFALATDTVALATRADTPEDAVVTAAFDNARFQALNDPARAWGPIAPIPAIRDFSGASNTFGTLRDPPDDQQFWEDRARRQALHLRVPVPEVPADRFFGWLQASTGSPACARAHTDLFAGGFAVGGYLVACFLADLRPELHGGRPLLIAWGPTTADAGRREDGGVFVHGAGRDAVMVALAAEDAPPEGASGHHFSPPCELVRLRPADAAATTLLAEWTAPGRDAWLLGCNPVGGFSPPSTFPGLLRWAVDHAVPMLHRDVVGDRRHGWLTAIHRSDKAPAKLWHGAAGAWFDESPIAPVPAEPPWEPPSRRICPWGVGELVRACKSILAWRAQLRDPRWAAAADADWTRALAWGEREGGQFALPAWLHWCDPGFAHRVRLGEPADPGGARHALDVALWRWEGGTDEDFGAAVARMKPAQRWIVRGARSREDPASDQDATFDLAHLPVGVASVMLWQDTPGYDSQAVGCTPPGGVHPRCARAFAEWLRGCRGSDAHPRMGPPDNDDPFGQVFADSADPADRPLVALGPGVAPFIVVYNRQPRHCALLQDWLTAALWPAFCELFAEKGGRIHGSGERAHGGEPRHWLARIPDPPTGRWLRQDQVLMLVARLNAWRAFEDAGVLQTVQQWNDERAFLAVDAPVGTGAFVLPKACPFDGDNSFAGVSALHGQEFERLAVLSPATATGIFLHQQQLYREENAIPPEHAAVARALRARKRQRSPAPDDSEEDRPGGAAWR